MAGSVILALTVALTGCSRTITVTAKGRNILGAYFLCNGTGSLLGHELNPCRRYHAWRVSGHTYASTRVGQMVTLNW